jgi:hypothetical protein
VGFKIGTVVRQLPDDSVADSRSDASAVRSVTDMTTVGAVAGVLSFLLALSICCNAFLYTRRARNTGAAVPPTPREPFGAPEAAPESGLMTVGSTTMTTFWGGEHEHK